MNGLIERLKSGAPILTDGAWGSLFLAAGLDPGELGDAWNLTHPDRVEAVPRAYVEAGSQVILTNTFRCGRITLKKHGLYDRIAELNRTGVEISRRAAAGRALVFGSLGPTGRLLVAGEVTREELVDVFTEQAGILAAAGPDALVVETMADLEEAKVAVEACRKTGLPVVACMVFDSGRNRDRTMMGVTPEQAAAGLAEAGADVIGANCGQGIPGYVSICRRLRATTELPLWLKPNAGLPELLDGRTVYKTSPEEFAAHVPALVEAGAAFVGGCCGTTPEFIRAVAGKIRPASA
ncbi:MAG TPA: homocysteine S-methyltransferase family protein [Bryobacteraceae bacterium]|nr:homocysteine S-methyltransferase family protein [Bryobacteraceae bacterium]